MSQEVITTSKEYSVKMSGAKIETISSTDQGIIVSGTTQFQMTTNTTGQSNYTIPDFTKTIEGTLKLVDETPIIELRKISIEEAKILIYKYVKEHPGSRTSDLIIELALDPDVVIEGLAQLRDEGKIEGKSIATK